MATEEYCKELVKLAKSTNCALVLTPCCPVCQEYGVPQSRIATIGLPCTLEVNGQAIRRDGMLVLLCADCQPDVSQLIQDILFWEKTGFATFHVDS